MQHVWSTAGATGGGPLEGQPGAPGTASEGDLEEELLLVSLEGGETVVFLLLFFRPITLIFHQKHD